MTHHRVVGVVIRDVRGRGRCHSQRLSRTDARFSDVVLVVCPERWAIAVNADGRHGNWRYAIVRDVAEIPKVLG